MGTKGIYYSILLVYLLLWICQLVVCHMTHSLVILTDSYINLYKILSISLGILHFCTQRELTKNQKLADESANNLKTPILAGRLFDCICTYQFKRLPLLGSFINGLFLAALLMSAAIEGIQTCVHSSHSQSPYDESILHRDRLTYPVILAGFAFVGLIMQHCSLKAHALCEEELQSASLLDLADKNSQRTQFEPNAVLLHELSANNLERRPSASSSSTSFAASKRRSYNLSVLQRQTSTASATGRLKNRQSSLQELPMSLAEREIPNNRETRISLMSLKFTVNLESIVPPIDEPIGTISHELATAVRPEAKYPSKRDNWFLVRFLSSPTALLVYALINYLLTDDLLTEIFDASLSICVVILLFAASYPQMKKAGRVLLQTVPDGVDLVKLEKELVATSPYIMRVNNLHVWSLTSRSNRIATCEIVLDKSQVSSEKQVEHIISEARYKFLDQNIKCTTIEPLLKGRDEENK